MRVNQSKLLTNLVGVVSLAGASLLITLPSVAREALNPNPSIFQEAPYNRSQGIQANVSQLTKDNNKKPVAQNPAGRTNPRPSIFNEPPYNRGSGGTTSAPVTPPTTKPRTQTPATQTPPAGTSSTQGKSLLALVQSSSSFTTLNKAIQAAGLTETLQGNNNLTVFAPTDAAFAKLPPDALKALLQPENKEVLVKVLTYHVVPGSVLSSDLKSGEVKSVEGGAINVKVDAQGVTVNDAKVVQADIKASNGVVHAIDTVILPPDL
ncbi:fasciclin domain-containing protein [Nostoc sp. MS1]|uniref:fasciclin domain-containing protein n=1 Tax=Nostoc sp. MS1 TaxID=2764711 RepID=UPI001CC64458|nr:fasciclin domain-containing protein [Nostoc sp. MS1]BCL38482.1 hypothetical protein NSMS1_49290 [Nostoc sp. MS1]